MAEFFVFCGILLFFLVILLKMEKDSVRVEKERKNSVSEKTEITFNSLGKVFMIISVVILVCLTPVGFAAGLWFYSIIGFFFIGLIMTLLSPKKPPSSKDSESE
jgi:archaellum biogenesis protein FlaJ (TadC family)